MLGALSSARKWRAPIALQCGAGVNDVICIVGSLHEVRMVCQACSRAYGEWVLARKAELGMLRDVSEGFYVE